VAATAVDPNALVMEFSALVVVGLTGAWWWQNHKAQQEEIATMADQSSAQLSQNNNEGQSVPLTDSNADNSAPLADNGSTPVDTGVAPLQSQTPAVTGSATAQQPAFSRLRQ